ncbi:MAG: 30S ribosomal protein S17 [Thermoleophilia bacterium]|jgi:small subunit ribosomal protein S17|nr:30S ribosomal protein S17 [Thermoleophilia bacterium]
MATKKTDSGKPAPKQSAARKPAAKKAAAAKAARKTAGAKSGAAAKKTAATKTAATKAAPKKTSAARAKAKAARPAPERVPGRKERRGIVVSDAMDKTIVVRIDVVQKHERYGKVVRRSTKLHAHDEHNTAGVGDLVRLVETRPLSATKRWRLLDVLEKAK